MGILEKVEINVVIQPPHSAEQLSFVASRAKRRIIKAGRRVGKTVGIAIRSLLRFCGICPQCAFKVEMGKVRAATIEEKAGCSNCGGSGVVEPKRVLYMAPTAEQVDTYWREITNALAEGVERGTLKRDATERYIEVEGTERRIKAKTAWNADTARGDYADELIFEEIQLMNESAWEDVGAPMLLDNNGDATFIFTPPSLKSGGISKARDPRYASKMYQRAVADKTGRWEAFHFTSYQNPLLSHEALVTITSDMSIEAHRREILAEDDELEQSILVYGKFDEERCKIRRFDIPKTWPIIVGHDFGKANPAALFVAQVKLPLPVGAPGELRYGDLVFFREYSPGAGFSTVQHIEKFREITRDYRVERALGGNITTEGELRQGYGGQGWVIQEPLLTKVNAQIDRVIGLMENKKLYIFEDLYFLLSQISSCMWEVDSENKPTNKIKGESRFHLLACLRYLCTYFPVEYPFRTYDRIIHRVQVY